MAGTVLVGKWKELGESFLLYPVATVTTSWGPLPTTLYT